MPAAGDAGCAGQPGLTCRGDEAVWLAAPAIAVYGLTAMAGLGLALRASLRGGPPAGRLLPLLALAVFLAASLAGGFFAKPILGGLGLRAEYAPYLDDDGAFALVSAGLAMWAVVVALVARWRGLLAAGMAAQGLALLLNPGLVVAGVRYGLPPDAYGLLALPPLRVLRVSVVVGVTPRTQAGEQPPQLSTPAFPPA